MLMHTPPTPGLPSSLHLSQLLLHTYLCLIASMFTQMVCEALATCHHTMPLRFIATSSRRILCGHQQLAFNQGGVCERKVVVKLSDFGLSTHDAILLDTDCGRGMGIVMHGQHISM